jgi:ABC-type nitrate/sulfonate/bicarbonate transport system substrate-binding protein
MSHTKLTRRSALWLAPATLGATSLDLATLGGARPARAAPVAFKITVSSNSLAYGGMHIALSAGLFEKHGLAPQVVVMHSGNAATAALISGSAPFASSGVGEVLAARVRGQDVVIVANLYHGLLGSVVLAKSVADKLKTKATAPVDERLKALSGLVIAAPSATSAYTIPLRSAAEMIGLKLNLTYMSQPAMVSRRWWRRCRPARSRAYRPAPRSR